ncbi:MAG: hypothetical protein ABI425_05570 [Patescibacteria group bacterium]
MKKSTLLTGLVLGSIVLAGCKAQTPTTTDNTPTDSTKGGSTTDKMKSWADAVKIGGGLKCTMTDNKTSKTVNYLAKGRKTHMSGQGLASSDAKSSSEIIMDGEFVYMWDTTKKEGVKMTMPTEEEIKAAQNANNNLKDVPDTLDFSNPDTMKKFEDENTNVDCSPAIISDAEFVPPTEVKFQDFSAMMKNSMQKVQEGMSDSQKKEVQDAMKQYSNQ